MRHIYVSSRPRPVSRSRRLIFSCPAAGAPEPQGISTFLKEQDPSIKVVLIDPPARRPPRPTRPHPPPLPAYSAPLSARRASAPQGSGLYNKVTRGVMFDRVEAEGLRLRNPFDTITEGIGINRLTANFARARIDLAIRCGGSDGEGAATVLGR